MSGTAFYNGIIYTADTEMPVAEAFAVKDGKFIFVGKTSDLPVCEERIDIKGACVIPGLIDSHCHMFAGIAQAAANMLFIDSKTTPAQLAEAISTQLHNLVSHTETITVMGLDLTVGEFSAADIDSAIPDRPVLVFSNDGHALLLNTKAMEELGICKDTPDPDNSSYYVRDENGEPTGLVIEIAAMMPCKTLMKEKRPEENEEIIQQLAANYSELGYTGIFEAMSFIDNNTDVPEILQKMDKAGRLPLHISTSFGYYGDEIVDAETMLELMKRNRDMYSSENVSYDTLKIIIDGTVEEHSALLYEPYTDSEDNYGSEMINAEDMKKAARLAADEGFSVHIHAIGDKAVTRALDVLCGLKGCEGTRTVAHNQLYTEDDIARIINDGGIFFQTTPQWAKNDNYTLQYIGGQRFGKQFRTGTMQRGGVTVTFGSDSCLEPETANAFVGMLYACARGNSAVCGKVCLPPQSESISRMESLFAYTINAAKQLRIENKTGSISVGKLADFVVIDRDVINCPIQELRDTQVMQTWFCGKRVFMKQH